MHVYSSLFKRFFDLIVSLALLPIVLLEIIVLAPAIWLCDKGPVFYNAKRAGKDYKPFKMFKLRSMYINSPDWKNPDGSTFNSDYDPRVTPVGRILRKTSLDEFPQFLNVFLGDMSLIGPRPKVYKEGRLEQNDVTADIKKSFTVKPGITGYSQAYYRNSITQEEKVKWDAYYADNISFWLDVKIIWQTIISVIKRDNVNTVHNS